MEKCLFFFTICAVLCGVFCSTCVNPQVTSKSFTTLDATIVSNIAYISEFSVQCSSEEIGNLYAELDGNVFPVSIVGSNKYQVSWTEDIESARSGDRVIRFFDEDGYTTYRKAVRSGEDISTVSPSFTVTINHPGAFNGPWLKSEFIATILSLVVAYFAVASRSKVVS
ncbi:hypothetical protein NQ317_014211 [Molorchus minor]|uniref:Translocon-associated protein subunit delta n=1 Tax=Molorchus minor TaxID=1323400 RepID=A0ABQ9JF13_9CUCU|nr:hypothetical protein NQ317_014211 [Molorchus minor]